MHPGQELVKLFHGTMAGKHEGKELDGVDAADQRAGKRDRNGRIIVVFAHNGEVHGLRVCDAHLRMHFVQQVHIEE